MRNQKINILNYTDIQKYFKDYYAWRKSEDPDFCYQYFAKKAKINKGFAYGLLNGNKNIPPAHFKRISIVIHHGKIEARYLKLLTALRKERSIKSKKEILEKLLSMWAHGRGFTKKQIYLKNLLEFNSELYHSTILSQIESYSLKKNYRKMAELILPKISLGKVIKSIKLLTDLGMIKKGKDGILRRTNKINLVDKEVEEIFNYVYHQKCSKLAVKGILPIDNKGWIMPNSMVVASKESVKEILSEVEGCKKRITNIAKNTKNADSVYLINMNIFPMTMKKKWTNKIRSKSKSASKNA